MAYFAKRNPHKCRNVARERDRMRRLVLWQMNRKTVKVRIEEWVMEIYEWHLWLDMGLATDHIWRRS